MESPGDTRHGDSANDKRTQREQPIVVIMMGGNHLKFGLVVNSKSDIA